LKQALRTQNFFYRKHSTEVLSVPVIGVRSGSMFARLLILLLPLKAEALLIGQNDSQM